MIAGVIGLIRLLIEAFKALLRALDAGQKEK
jgi:hypothetical protein